MTSDWTTGIHEGYRTKVVRIGNATVQINRPILDAKEQARRENEVIHVLSIFGKEVNYGKRIEHQ